MPQKFVQLNRTLIRVKGSDTLPFLQGLLSQDITKITSTHSLYSLLLTPQGKFLHDMFVIPTDPEISGLFIECDKERALDLLNRLNLYKLRSDISLDVITDAQVFAFWDSEAPLGEISFISENLLTYQDPRLQNLGGKLLSLSSSKHPKHILQNRGRSEGSLEDYHIHLLKLGVPFDTEDMIPEKAIPLECGMDELHAIDWTKGCYMGQELTARTRYRGLVRKRLIPGVLEGVPKTPFKTRLMFEGSEAGTTRSSEGGFALALIRLEFLKKSLATHAPFTLFPPEDENFSGDVRGTFMPFVPPWMEILQEEE